MSFSSDVKNEIVASLDNSRKQRLCYILGMLCFGGKLINFEDTVRLRFSTENPKIARKFYTIIKNEFSIKAKLTIHKTKKTILYMVAVDDEKYIEELFYITGLLKRGTSIKDFISYGISPSVMSNADYRKAFIKGAFLGGASISDPQKTSHVEFVTSHYRLSRDFAKLLEKSELKPKTVVRKSNYVIYFKR